MPMKIIIVGGGIAGLATAISLKQGGHEVKIFEKSRFATETGAAVAVPPNGGKVLSKIGFSFERAQAVVLEQWNTVDAVDLRLISSAGQRDVEEKWGHPLRSLHRVDYHKELLRLARIDGQNETDILQLSSPVLGVDLSTGEITLANGDRHRADLIIGADGLHSVVRKSVLPDEEELKPSGANAFRFLIPTQKMMTSPDLRDILLRNPSGTQVFADTTTKKERHLVWYACRGGEIQNLVGITELPCSTSDKAELRRQFSHLHPDLMKVIDAAEDEDVKVWPLFQREPLSQWVYDKVLLIGDAAHPMLTYSGQGASQALEDAGALGYLLAGADISQLTHLLQVFEKVRIKRAARIQILSSARSGREVDVAARVAQWVEPEGPAVPKDFQGRVEHDWSFDVFAKCQELM